MQVTKKVVAKEGNVLFVQVVAPLLPTRPGEVGRGQRAGGQLRGVETVAIQCSTNQLRNKQGNSLLFIPTLLKEDDPCRTRQMER